MGRGKSAGIETRRGFVSWNGNSGISALSLAYHLGARKVVLLGFDMHTEDDGKSNYHDQHIKMDLHKAYNKKEVYTRYLKKLPEVKTDAKRIGMTIINATPGSSIEEFPIMTLEEALNGSLLSEQKAE